MAETAAGVHRNARRAAGGASTMAINFDLAPPAVVFDGKMAVPIDIATIDTHLSFDGAGGGAHGDATISFVVGPVAGRPIFDLRQTVTGMWMDGSPLSLTQVLTRDLGGCGPQYYHAAHAGRRPTHHLPSPVTIRLEERQSSWPTEP
jgi:hypothetical protein